jgi:hypothetical protein
MSKQDVIRINDILHNLVERVSYLEHEFESGGREGTHPCVSFHSHTAVHHARQTAVHAHFPTIFATQRSASHQIPLANESCTHEPAIYTNSCKYCLVVGGHVGRDRHISYIIVPRRIGVNVTCRETLRLMRIRVRRVRLHLARLMIAGIWWSSLVRIGWWQHYLMCHRHKR